MDRPRHEYSPDAEKYVKLGKLLDAAGFGGPETSFDLVDFVEAASSAIAFHHFDSEEYQKYVRAAFVREYDDLKATRLAPDRIASYLVGSVLWRAEAESMAEPASVSRNQVSRAIENVALSRQVFGYGDERWLHMSLTRHTEQFSDEYKRSDRVRLRNLCHHAESECMRVKRLKPLGESVRLRTPYRYHLINGLSSIALMQGYHIQPPEDQRDENGVWKLPDERDDDEL